MLKMAFRNIFRQKRRSLLTALTMFGGFVLTTVAIGLTDGTFNSMVNLFTRSRLGHIQVHHQGYMSRPSLNKTIANYRQIGEILDGIDGVEAWAPRVYSAGLAAVGERSAAVRIVGLDPGMEMKATRFDRKISQGRVFSRTAAREIILGKGLAKPLQASVGDDVVLLTQGADGSLANELYHLIGLADSGDEISDRTTLYLHIDDARDLLVIGDRAHELAVVVRSLKMVAPATMALRRELVSFPVEVQPWQEFARSFYTAMEADQKGHRVMLLVLFTVVAVGVLNTAFMAVLERRREYGVLKALGTRPRQIFRLIVLEIQLLALASISLGAGLSFPMNTYLSHRGFSISRPISFGGMQYSMMTAEVNLRSFVIPAIIVVVTALFVSVFPAIKAARTEPAKSVRVY
jgi:putative ABC transport system permease protein